MTATLTAPETREFAKLESDIESGLDGFVKAGNALAKIRDKRLYRDSHGSFDVYCRARWNLGKSRAYQLISSAEIAEQVSAIVDDQPKRESHVRPLAKLPEEQRQPAWREAVETAADGVTAEHVEAVVASRLSQEELSIADHGYADDFLTDRDVAVMQAMQSRDADAVPDATGHECPKGGDHEWTQDDGETYCEKCLEPIDVEPANQQPAKPKSTIVDRCQAFWDSLTSTERIIAAGWFQDQLG